MRTMSLAKLANHSSSAPGVLAGVRTQTRRMFAAAALLTVLAVGVSASAMTSDVTKKPSSTKITVSTHSVPQHHSGVITVKVTPNTASGTATVYYKNIHGGSTTTYGTIAISHGVGSGIRKGNEVGTFNVWVVYGGSATLKPSTSNTEQITITKP